MKFDILGINWDLTSFR